MDKEGNYSGNFQGVDYSIDHHGHQLMKPRIGEETYVDASNQLVDYTSLNSHPRSSTSPDKLSFADVMQFADFGPRLGLINQTKIPEEAEVQEEEEETGIDPVYFLRFPVLNEDRYKGMGEERGGEERGDGGEGRANSENNNNNATSVGVGIVGGNFEKNLATDVVSNKNKRKRARSVKTTEEVESQRMTHIAVERNRRKQMNEHLRVLRSLMPGSYVQRGDQASIIGGAIEFVRELEQLLQCLESQKRRRLYGDPPPPRPMGDSSTSSLANIPQPPQPGPPPFFPPQVVPLMLPNDHDNQLKLVDFDPTAGIREETAESKSVLADVEVKMLGFDAMIKILSRRRPGQLIKTIAALEDLQLIILHTNITTIEQTVLYSFNVKVTSEARFSAEDIASSVQQIFSFIHANNAPI